MRAATVIILTSGKAESLRQSIDSIVKTILSEKRVPVLVLGPDADTLLEASTQIENCEIVFDPNYIGGEFSGIKAGLHATAQAAYVWNGEGEFPASQSRYDLELDLPGSSDDALVTHQESSQCLITRAGVTRLRSLNASTQWRMSPLVRFRTVHRSDEALPSLGSLLDP